MQGKKVKEILKDIGMTQQELAQRLDMRETNLSKLLNKKSNPTESTIKRLCEILGCTPNDIL